MVTLEVSGIFMWVWLFLISFRIKEHQARARRLGLRRGEKGKNYKFAALAQHSDPELGTCLHCKATLRPVMWHEMATMKNSTASQVFLDVSGVCSSGF